MYRAYAPAAGTNGAACALGLTASEHEGPAAAEQPPAAAGLDNSMMHAPPAALQVQVQLPPQAAATDLSTLPGEQAGCT